MLSVCFLSSSHRAAQLCRKHLYIFINIYVYIHRTYTIIYADNMCVHSRYIIDLCRVHPLQALEIANQLMFPLICLFIHLVRRYRYMYIYTYTHTYMLLNLRLESSACNADRVLVSWMWIYFLKCQHLLYYRRIASPRYGQKYFDLSVLICGILSQKLLYLARAGIHRDITYLFALHTFLSRSISVFLMQYRYSSLYIDNHVIYMVIY